jgi:hypothetical protein
LANNEIYQKYFSHFKIHFKEDADEEYVVIGLDVSMPVGAENAKVIK